MCKLTELQQNIISFTRDGEHIARFLTETMRGETPGVKVCHRMDAAKQLIRYGFTNADCDTNPSQTQEERVNSDQSPLSLRERARVRETDNTPSPSMGEGWDGGDNPTHLANPVSYLDILNYETAHLIRHETADGHTIVNFLVDIMTGRDRPFTPKKFCIKPADRMAAARELLRRGFGDLGSRRRLSDTSDEANAYDTLHTDLAKRMREYSERGADTIRFLLEVMSDPNPEEEFTIHHRMSAAQELLRRGWDTNYDNIKPEQLQDYWRDEQSTRLSVGQKKTQAGLSTYIDDYDKYDDTDYAAIAKEMREEDDREAATPATKLPLPQGEGWGEGSDNSLPPRRGKARMGVTEPVSSGMPRSESGDTATSKLPFPQGEGWGEGKETNTPSVPTLPKNLPLNKSGDEPADRKAIIREFREAMDRGDERAALRAQAKYRRIDIKAEKNIYDYGPNDPDPTIDYYFEPLNPEEQAKFDEEERREYGLTEEEIVDFSSMRAPRGMSDPLVQLAEAAEAHNTPILPNPLTAKHKNPTIRSP